MPNKLIYAANWKLNFTAAESLNFISKHKQGLSTLNATIVLCPSFTALSQIAHALADTHIAVGSQDNSPHTKGAHTGQVSAQDLASIGCRYGIVGHSERRAECKETDDVIAAKAQALLDASISPIICIGEKNLQPNNNSLALETQEVLAGQLAFKKNLAPKGRHFFIAYEPVWAIGTGAVAQPEHIQRVFDFIKHELVGLQYGILYGGSVSSKNIQSLKNIAGIGGFLIGGASLDFQEFEKIVNLS